MSTSHDLLPLPRSDKQEGPILSSTPPPSSHVWPRIVPARLLFAHSFCNRRNERLDRNISTGSTRPRSDKQETPSLPASLHLPAPELSPPPRSNKRQGPTCASTPPPSRTRAVSSTTFRHAGKPCARQHPSGLKHYLTLIITAGLLFARTHEALLLSHTNNRGSHFDSAATSLRLTNISTAYVSLIPSVTVRAPLTIACTGT